MRYLRSQLSMYVKILQASVLIDQVLPLRRGKIQAVAALQGLSFSVLVVVYFQLLEHGGHDSLFILDVTG